jgi:hypothetical protein
MTATVSLSDDDLDTIMVAATPLPVRDRCAFLRAIAAELTAHPDATVFDAIATVQWRFLRDRIACADNHCGDARKLNR